MEWRKKKRYGDQKSKQNNSITTTAAIAELIGQTSKKAQAGPATASSAALPVLFLFWLLRKCGWWKIFSGYIASIFFFPFFQENDLKVTENIPENVG